MIAEAEFFFRNMWLADPKLAHVHAEDTDNNTQERTLKQVLEE